MSFGKSSHRRVFCCSGQLLLGSVVARVGQSYRVGSLKGERRKKVSIVSRMLDSFGCNTIKRVKRESKRNLDKAPPTFKLEFAEEDEKIERE